MSRRRTGSPFPPYRWKLITDRDIFNVQGDGALGFWNALHKVYGETKQQRCWMHKTGNVLNKLPKTLHSRAKQHIHDIWMAETKEGAEKGFDFFVKAYQAKYPNVKNYRLPGCFQ